MTNLLSMEFNDWFQTGIGILSIAVTLISASIAFKKLFTIKVLEAERKKDLVQVANNKVISGDKHTNFEDTDLKKKREELKKKLLEGKAHVTDGNKIVIPPGKLAGGINSINFENEHLSNYYLQVLYQSKISFWFSLIFASLGFLIIILSIFLYKEGSFDKSILSLVSGLLIDAVSALFFVQSNKAQKAMGDFFEKLRIDKNNLEARRVCELIENKHLRDITKVQLAFKLVEINPTIELNDKIMNVEKTKEEEPIK